MSGRGEMNRREFLKKGGRVIVGIAGANLVSRSLCGCSSAEAAINNRVVKVRCETATNWDYVTDYYYDFYDEKVVDTMFTQGLLSLTGSPSPKEAWQMLKNSYAPGDKVVIKINGNNWMQNDAQMDATIPVINCVLGGLIEVLGIPESDIEIIDPSRPLSYSHDRLEGRCHYPGVAFQSAAYQWDQSVLVEFAGDQPTGDGNIFLASAITGAEHLINIPILKSHSTTVTGCMKNHYGSVRECNQLHTSMYTNNFIGDVNNNPHIRGKTRLIVGDALFGNWETNGAPPNKWLTFPGETPNCLLLSLDPVAFDSVWADDIIAEREAQGANPKVHDWLHVAAGIGLGIHEHRPYTSIDYVEINQMPSPTRSQVDRVVKWYKQGLTSERNVKSYLHRYNKGL